MVNVPFIPTGLKRIVSTDAEIVLRNRYAEENPILNSGQASLVSRPRLKKFIEVGSGHIRKTFSQPGVFNDDLFVVSGTDLYKVTKAGTSTNVGTISTSTRGDVSMAAVAPVGNTIPAMLFIAEGGIFWVYTDNGQALGHLSASGAIANNDVVKIDSTYYKFTTGSVDTGTPAGTVGSPWLINLGASNAIALTNLFNAINLEAGVAGTDYSTATTGHLTVSGYSVSANDLYVVANDFGTGGNAISTTETGANIAWGGTTLAGGGSSQLRQVHVPDDSGAISVATLNSYVIVIPVQTSDINGRFYWLNPGEIKIDPLSFATAEKAPDGLYQVVVFGERAWLLGQNTTEPWITTGDASTPFARFQGVVYDRGASAGCGIQVKDNLFIIDEDGKAFLIGEGLKKISNAAVEERIRRGLQRAALLG